MRTLLNSSAAEFRVDGEIHKSMLWRAEPPSLRANQIGLARTAAHFRGGTKPAQTKSPGPQTPEFPNDNSPFSALIWLARQMRQ